MTDQFSKQCNNPSRRTLRVSWCGLIPVVVRASTLATVYAFFSMEAAASATTAAGRAVDRKNAMVAIFARIREIVSSRCF